MYGKSVQFTYFVGYLICEGALQQPQFYTYAYMNCDLLVPVSQFLSVYPGAHVQE